MCASKHLILTELVSLIICGLAVGEWRGFRGIEKDGRHLQPDGPLTWSSSQNVVWKTPIPGRGHSSPIVSGKKVYVTTTYEVSDLSYNMWNYMIALPAFLLVAAGMNLVMRTMSVEQNYEGKVLRHLRLFLFVQVLTAVAVVALFGRHLLDFESDAARPLLASVVLILCCLTIGLLFVPLKSRKQLIAGLFSFVFAVLVLFALKRKGLSIDPGSMKGLIKASVLFCPVVFGFALITAHFLSRRRKPTTIHNLVNVGPNEGVAWGLVATACGGLVAGLAPFALLIYRAAGYRMPDSYIWDTRVKPNTGWLFVGLCVIAVIGSIAVKSVRRTREGHLPVKTALFVISIVLGTAFFIQTGFINRPDEFARVLMCLDADSGRILWRCEGLTGKTKGRSRTVTYASPTPVTDGERIYAYFGEDGLMCVNTEGRLLWKKTDPMFKGQHGVGTSPVVKDKILIIVRDVRESEELPSSISAFDCATGKRLWEKNRKSHEEFAAYGTPVIKELNEEQTIIVHGWHDVKAYQLESGRELWSYPIAHEGKHLVASLTCDGERLYVTGMKQIIALELSRLATGSDPIVWSTPIVGEKSSTPVVISGLMFLVTEKGMAFCLDSKTGEILWEKRLPGRYFSSVTAAANHVFFTSESGQTTVIAIDREFRKLAANALGESVYATPAQAGNRLFLRTIRHLYCLQELKSPVSLLTRRSHLCKI